MKTRRLHTVFAATAAATLLFMPLGSANAEELRMSVMEQTKRGLQQELPRNGMSQSSVRNGWGEPQATTAPVGQPPISEWHYQNFVVYFEGDRVIHSVLKHNR